MAQIDTELDDLLLPWMIDLSRHSDLSHPPLLDHIERVGEVFYRHTSKISMQKPLVLDTAGGGEQ